MDTMTGPCKFTAVFIFLGVTTLMSVQCVDLHHLKKCPLITKFPTAVKVSINMTAQVLPPQNGDINKRSTSPWTYSYDRNVNRFPVVIAEAMCEKAACVDAEGKVDNGLSSVHIRQEILILYRELKGCVPSFRLEKKLLTVGCTCTRPITIEQM